MRPKPRDEIHHIGIAPHPDREPSEIVECLDRTRITGVAADVPIDATGVGPVGLGRDRSKSMLDNEPLRDPCALAVELVCAVRGFADQHEAGVANGVDERVVIVRVAVQALRPRSNDVDGARVVRSRRRVVAGRGRRSRAVERIAARGVGCWRAASTRGCH